MTGVYSLVRAAVDTLDSGASEAMLEMVARLAAIAPDQLLPELLVEVADAASGVDLSDIPATDLLPDPALTAMIVRAVVDEDVALLDRALPGGYAELIPALVASIVALERART